jgi:hypothetical protein
MRTSDTGSHRGRQSLISSRTALPSILIISCCIVLILSSTLSAFAQNSTIDSLNKAKKLNISIFCSEAEHRRDADRFPHCLSRWSGQIVTREPECDDYPFPVHNATEQVSYPLHPPIFVAQYSMTMRCGRGIHDGGFRLHPGSGYCASHGTRGNPDTRIAANPFDLPSLRQGVDIQDTMIFSKPYGGLDWCPIPFETLQGEISLTHKGGKALARHGNAFMLDTVGTFSCNIVPRMRRLSVQYTAVGERYGRENRDESIRPPVSPADADRGQGCRRVAGGDLGDPL